MLEVLDMLKLTFLPRVDVCVVVMLVVVPFTISDSDVDKFKIDLFAGGQVIL